MAISLLPHDQATQENKALKKIMNIGAAMLGGYLVVMTIVGGLFVYLNLQEKSLARSHEALAADIKSQQSKEEKLVLLKDRISTLSKLPQALNFHQVLDILPDLVGTDLTVDEVSLSEGKLKLVVQAQDTFGVEELVKNLNKSSKLTEATMENLDLSQGGTYIATLFIKVKTQ